MGKSNNLHNNLDNFFYKEKKIHHFFEKDEIKILENINDCFIKEIMIDFDNFFKKDIKLIFHNIKIKLDNNNNNIKNSRCVNLIEISPYQKQSFITFSSGFLSFMIDLLFGGNGEARDVINQTIDMTSTELLINKKMTTLIVECLSNIYKKFYDFEIEFINIKVLIDLKKFNFNSNELFIISSFNFKVNNIEIFFSILVPISMIKKINRKKLTSIKNNQSLNIEKNIFCFKDLYDIELDIVAKITIFSISFKSVQDLSIGDVLLIKKPNKIIACIENQPVFFGKYRRFNTQTIIFIEEFINNNLESNQNKENSLMSNIQENPDNEKLIDSKEETLEYKNTNANSLFQKKSNKNISSVSKKNKDNEKILLDKKVNITVELGKTKIKIKDFLNFSKGSMLVLDKLTTESLDIFINGRLIASGEIVVLDEKYGIRITDVKNSSETVNISS